MSGKRVDFQNPALIVAAFFLFIAAYSSITAAAGSASANIKAVAIDGGQAGSAIWGPVTYTMSCADSANTTYAGCTTSGTTRTLCTYTFFNCSTAGDFYSYANFSGLVFPASADTTTGNSSNWSIGNCTTTAAYSANWVFLYTSYCSNTTNYANCTSDNATFYNNTCTSSCGWSNSSTTCSANGCCGKNCTASVTGGCATWNDNSACNSPTAPSCPNATYKREYSSPGTCSGCGANGATGSCAYPTYTDTICGVGSGCCSSGSCTAAGASDGCCPTGANPATDADCSITFVTPTESDGAYKSQTYYYVNATFAMANSTGCRLEVGGANNTMTQALGSSTNYCYLNRTSQSDAAYTYKVYVNTTNSTGTYWGASSSRTVNLETTPPTGFTFVSPSDANNSFAVRNYFYVNATFTELNSGSAACVLEVNNLNGTTTNISMTRSNANCYVNLTSQTAKNYTYKVYANDTAGNINASFGRQINLENYTTSGTISSATPYSITVGSSSDYNLTVSLNLTNTPQGNMSGASLSYSSNLPAGWSINTSTSQSCGAILKGASCERNFSVIVPAGTTPTSKTITWRADWTDNNGASHSPIVFHQTVINVVSQPNVSVNTSIINRTVNPTNTADITPIIINATGNADLENVKIYLNTSLSYLSIALANKSTQGCTRNSATNWSCTRICGGSGCDPSFDPNNLPFNFTLTVPRGTAASNTIATLNVSTSNAGYQQIPVNITIPTFGEWSISPATQSLQIGFQETGSLGSVTLNNTGNVNLTLSISCSGAYETIVSLEGVVCDTPPSIFVAKQASNVSNVTLSTGQQVGFAFNVTYSNSSGTPISNYSTFNVNVTDRAPRTEYAAFSLTAVETNNNITITANLSDDYKLYDSRTQFEITPAGQSAKNYSPTRISGSTNASQGNFSLNFSNTTWGGTYSLKVYSFDDTGKVNASNHSFSVVNYTQVVVSSNQSSFTISGVTQDAGAWFLANITFNNTGYAKAYYANASASLPSGWNISYSTFTDNQNLSSGAVNYSLANVSIPAGTAALGYSPAPSLSWKHANGTSASNATVLAVTVASNPQLRFLNYSSNYTIFQGNDNTSTVVLDSYGNTNVSSINLSCSGSACTTFNITFNESSISSLNGGLQRAINITITVPSGTANNTYNVTITAAGGSGTNASFNASIVVPQSSGWAFTPTTLTLYRVGASADNYSGISLWNYGNTNQSISSISLNGTLSSAITLNQSSISSLAGQSSQVVWLRLNTPNSTATYSGYLIASNGTSEQSVPITINAYQYSVAIISPTTASPTSQLSVGDNVSIVARILLDGSPVSVNTTFNASVSNQTCSVSSYSASAGLWSIACGAPAIIGSLYGDLNITANYSLGPGWLLSSALQTSAVRYVDTSPPQIGSSSLPTVDLGSGNTIQLNMTDNDAVSWTNVAVFTPSGTSIHSQNYSSPNISITFTAGQLSEAGDYGVLVNSTDITGNTNNTVVYFEVLDAKVLTGTLTDATSTPLSATLKFKRPNRGEILVQNTTNASGGYYARVGKRYYDFELALGSTSITLRNASINASTSALLSEADVVPTTAVTIPGSAPVKVYVAAPAIQYSSALLNISFADSLSSLVYEGNLHLYKCSDWNYGSRVCRSSWTRVSGSSVDKATHRLLANVSSFSAYAVVENYCGDSVCRPDLGETYPSCPSDCPATLNVSPNATVTQINETITSATAGAASVSLAQYISQLEELRNNPQLSNATREEIASLIERLKKLKDEKEITSEMLEEINRIVKKAQEELGIRLASQNIYLELYAGESTVTSAHVKNTLNADSTVTITMRGDVSRFVSFTQSSLQLKPQEEGTFAVAVSIPIETAPAVYFGEIQLQNERGNVSVPMNIRVLEPQEKVLDLKIHPLAETVAPGQNLQVEVNMYNLGDVKRIDVQLKLQMLDQTAERAIQEYEEAISLENQLTATKTLQIPLDTADGKYIVRAQAYYPDKFGKTREAVNIAYVLVNKPLYALTIFGIPITIIAAIAIALLLAGAYLYYTKIETERKRRYLEKIDFTKLPAPGPRSGFIGKIAESNVRAFVELDKLSTHTLAAGATGSGKTVAAQVLIEEALKKGISVVVFDPTAQWTGFLRPQKNREMLEAYKEFNIPTSEAQAFKGNIHVVRDPKEKIEFKKLVKPGEITVFVLNKLKQAPLPKTTIAPGAKEISIAKLGEQPSGVAEKLAQAAGPANAQKEPSEMEQFVANSIKTIFESNLEESKQLRLILVYDEVHRLLPKFGGSGLGFTQIERAVREFRKWGIGLVLVSQVLSDFIGEIKANIGTEIQMRTKYEGDLDRIKLKYGEDTMKSIVKASIGTAMLQNSEYNHGRPYFTTFRPLLHNVVRLTDSELSQYEEYNGKIERFALLVEKMKAGGMDVFDVELELDLARDKLKKGTFNIVDIYLESLQQKLKALEARATRK